MGSHHAPGDDRYPQDDPRTRRTPDPGSPYGRPAAEGRGGYAGAPTNPYTQQQQPPAPPQRQGEAPYGGGGYQPPQQSQPPAEAPRRRRRYAEEEQQAAPARPSTPEESTPPPVWGEHAPARPAYEAPSRDETPAPVWGEQAPARPAHEQQAPSRDETPPPVWGEQAPARQSYEQQAPSHDQAPPPVWGDPAPVKKQDPASWNDDQATQMYSHLGYVPREERRRTSAPSDGTFSLEASADDKKFKSMRRARRASGKAKAFMVIGLVAAIALIGGGIWYLNSGDDEGRADTGGVYAALEKPCSVLDLAPVSDLGLSEDQKRHRETSEAKSDGGAAQVCAVSLTSGDNKVNVDIGFDARVYDVPAKARNDWEFKLEAQKTAKNNGWKLTELSGEPGTQAFSLLQSWNADTASADYRLIFWHENVSVEGRLTILKQSQVDENDLAKRALELAKAYLAKWAA